MIDRLCLLYLPGGDMGLPVLRQAMEKKGGLLTKDEAVEAMQQETVTFFFLGLGLGLVARCHSFRLFLN